MSDLPASAADGIRRFSRVVWTVGTVVTAALAFFTMPTVVWDADIGRIIVDPGQYQARGDYPWQQEDPALLTVNDGIVTGDIRGGYIRLPAASDVLAITILSADSVGVSQGEDASWQPREWPELIGYFHTRSSPVYIVPGESENRLWFDSGYGAWQVRLDPVTTTPIGAEMSGTGDAVLEYRGDALSAHFTHDGQGIFGVTVVTWGEAPQEISEIDAVDARTSWKNSGRVIFVIDAADATGTWTVTVNE